MSPLWRRRLRIGVCPDRLVLGGKALRLEPAAGGAPWQAALAALPAALAGARRAPCEVTVILSNHFVRYALLPWNGALRGGDEWLALARHHFATVYGRAADPWSLRVAETAPRGARVASAVDPALLDALAPAVGAAGGTLVSIQPLLIAAFNRLRKRLGGSAGCWLVVAEPGRLVLALIEKGSWRALRARRADDNWQESLPEILERESAVLGLENARAQHVVHPEMALG